MLKELKHRLGPILCSGVPLEIWHRLYDVRLLLPRYHVVGDEEMDHISGLGIFRSVKQFKNDMEFFLRFYTPVSLNDVIQYLEGVRDLPKRCFLPSFDDGFRETYDVIAPILSSLGVSGVFFVNASVLNNVGLLCEQKKSLLVQAVAARGEAHSTQKAMQVLADEGINGSDLTSLIRHLTYRQRHILEKLGGVLACDFQGYAASVQPYLTSEQTITLIRKGFFIGAHSVDHPFYHELTLEEQLAQTRDCFDLLGVSLEYKPQAFAFPYMDTGVSPEFFEKMYADGFLKVSFGSDGLHRHYYPRNLERFKMEYPDFSASQILAREFYMAIRRDPSWVRHE